jgi:hypothetical protein
MGIFWLVSDQYPYHGLSSLAQEPCGMTLESSANHHPWPHYLCQGFWVGAYYERRLSRYLIEISTFISIWGYVWKWWIPGNHPLSWGKSGKMVISFQRTHLYIVFLFLVMSRDPFAPFHKRHTSSISNKGSWGAYCDGRDEKTEVNPGCLPINKTSPPLGFITGSTPKRNDAKSGVDLCL